MASVFKRGRDKGKRHAAYWIEFTDHQDKRRTRKGFSDKALTEQLAAKLENEALLRRRGLIDGEDEVRREQGKSAIETQLDAFEKSLGKNTSKHVKLTLSRIRRIVEACEWKSISEIDAEPVELALGEWLDDDEIGHKTYNHYLQAIDSFCNWLVSTRRMTASPLVGIKRLNTEVDVRHPRRALTAEEFGSLVQSARSSGTSIQCFNGEERARIYILSYMTGLRRKELASLTPRSFRLDIDPATVTVEAACSKHRRQDTLPLHPELVGMLRDWLAGGADHEPIFPKLAKRRTWLMVKKDLERVGIPYRNDEGIADFHAAGRHTHITELLRQGASLTEARELARHSDIRMTMKYTHVGLEEQAKAVSALRWQHIGSISRGQGCPSVSSSDSSEDEESNDPETPNPRECEGYDASCHELTPSGTEGAPMEAAGIEPATCHQLARPGSVSHHLPSLGIAV